MQHEIIIKSLADLRPAAAEFLSAIDGHSLIAFYAPMGAGKTTFSKAICQELGVDSDDISSPTFAIVNEYLTASDDTIYHFDFYRITKNEEALDIGLYDYLDSGNLCLMEWPENIEDLLPEETLKVHISILDDGTRVLNW
ncbi:MAG: tRNA (adenosine(37)-N6)-threonylcarbamoyltransferase complex ATPase subunit type 1 TsaE [Bacteroidales bacterium]|nr:tRNA (adenosine(37)-N6)-threonylcarbamoyltransferase complex ATPase subunit type 1 TsaE [Bacteroidales bacterium]MBQ5639748.1 tRNA (adenosine(37)-N6)-threonylcarbamoyltransferase complex ATPase subunit type 1 TsaE [Bacteroidales bacterium]